MSDPRIAFYFDVGSPYAYLAAERVLQTLPFAAEPRRAERSAGMFALYFAASIVAGFFPLFLSVVYRSLPLTFAVLGGAVAVTVAIVPAAGVV